MLKHYFKIPPLRGPIVGSVRGFACFQLPLAKAGKRLKVEVNGSPAKEKKCANHWINSGKREAA